MKKVFTFILKSSADPRAVSLSLKLAALGIIPYIMQATDMVCQYGHQCINLHPSLLEAFVEVLAATVFYVLTLIASVGSLVALGRKILRTLRGENRAINQL